jgi:hypothetical protein
MAACTWADAFAALRVAVLDGHSPVRPAQAGFFIQKR